VTAADNGTRGTDGTAPQPADVRAPRTPARRRRRVAGAVTGAVAGGAVVAAAAAVAFGGGSSSAASGTARLTVTGGYIPQPLLTDMAAAYVTVTNRSGSAAELTSVTSPPAAHVTLHTTVGTTMRQVSSLTVPARGRLALGLGEDHLMLENLVRRPAVGDKVALTLHFAHAVPATVTVTVPVRPTTYRPGS
jgi:periplasmic copper chaperone A